MQEFSVAQDWNPKQAALKETITKQHSFDEAIKLALQLHTFVHSGVISGEERTLFDEIAAEIARNPALCIAAGDKGRTIVYHIWHTTRIEDICANILIANGKEVLDAGFLARTNSPITETGNSLSAEEIAAFSRQINAAELLNYRIAVGKRTREVLQTLTFADIKRKPAKESLVRVVAEHAVSQKPEAIWLVDFWGRKTVAGLIEMPFTRHQIMHLSDCMKIIKKAKP